MRSYGEDITISRQLGAFNKLEIGQKFQLYISMDTTLPEQISIRYGSHLTDKIRTKIHDGILTIRDENKYNWVRDLHVFPTCTLNVHRLDEIVAEGVAELHSLDTIRTHNLVFHAWGNGTHELTVKCGSVSGECDNAGTVIFRGYGGILAWTCENGSAVNASEMRSSDVYLYHYTDRVAEVNPTSIFKAYVYGKGNVLYYQDPLFMIEKHEFGEGRILRQ